MCSVWCPVRSRLWPVARWIRTIPSIPLPATAHTSGLLPRPGNLDGLAVRGERDTHHLTSQDVRCSSDGSRVVSLRFGRPDLLVLAYGLPLLQGSGRLPPERYRATSPPRQ